MREARARDIQQLHDDGVKEREIATQLDIDRHIVHSVLSKRGRTASQIERTYVRCPGCGGLALMPCIACRAMGRQQ